MGADIHWVAERLHSEGSWEAVLSKASFRTAHGDYWWRSQSVALNPIEQFGDRDYTWFGLLSEVRGEPNDVIGLIAAEGLPKDASDHTLEALNYDGDLHSHGWFTIDMIQAALEKIKSIKDPVEDNEDAIETLSRHLMLLQEIVKIEDKGLAGPNGIIFGREYDPEAGIRFPDMKAESSHAALQRHTREAGLLPIEPDTFRICIAYDN
jgi:hypothetical protein